MVSNINTPEVHRKDQDLTEGWGEGPLFVEPLLSSLMALLLLLFPVLCAGVFPSQPGTQGSYK